MSPDLWPPNNPDIKPVDYNVWDVMQHRIYQTKDKDLDHLKCRPIDVWASAHATLRQPELVADLKQDSSGVATMEQMEQLLPPERQGPLL